jgi:hypothetical protein
VYIWVNRPSQPLRRLLSGRATSPSEQQIPPFFVSGAFDKLCSRRFQREVAISVPKDDIEWGYKNFHVFIAVHSREYIATRGKFSFSSKDCKESAPDDFAVGRTVDAEIIAHGKNADPHFPSPDPNADFYFMLMPTMKEFEKFSIPVCMRTLNLWGRL